MLDLQVEGRVKRRSDSDYELWRSNGFNRRIPHRKPEFIVRARTAHDVVEAVRFARAEGIKVSVRGRGHNWFGSSLRNGGMLIDLSALHEIAVDAARASASVQVGTTGRDLMRRLERDGLAFPVGHCADVPLSGYLLSGGFGWNSMVWGPACFHVTGIDVVTAEGNLEFADAEHHSDLFWAARGAGPAFFGAIVRYHLNLMPLPLAIRTSTVVLPVGRFREVAAWLGELRPKLAAAVEVNLFAGAAPSSLAGLPGVPDRVCVVAATAFADTPEEGRELLRPIATLPCTAQAIIRQWNVPTSFDGLFAAMSDYFPERYRYAADTAWTNHPLAEITDSLNSLCETAPARSGVLCVPLPPPPAIAPPAPDVAFSMGAAVFVASYAVWKDPKDDAACEAWHQQTVDALAPLAVGHYVGEANIGGNAKRAARCFSPEAWERLQSLRAKYDPTGVFPPPF